MPFSPNFSQRQIPQYYIHGLDQHSIQHRCLVYTVGLGLVRPPLGDGRRKVLESVDSTLPVNASIRNGDTLLQAAGALRWDLLVALVDVGLDHDTDDASLAVADLVGNVLGYEGLVAVVLVRVTCRKLAFIAL
jgi:hypothetical protein